MAAAEQLQERARSPDQTEGLELGERQVAECPKRGAETTGGKFCSECGAPLASKTTCPQRRAKLAAGARFCARCGAKV